ncbi:hypothetical protein JTM06_36435, partial [Pseudomonas aeruginosa]|nr:hypothetical protein [Pseudomonas aeruginosa]
KKVTTVKKSAGRVSTTDNPIKIHLEKTASTLNTSLPTNTQTTKTSTETLPNKVKKPTNIDSTGTPVVSSGLALPSVNPEKDIAAHRITSRNV